MFVSKILSRIPKNSVNQCRLLVTARPEIPSNLSNNLHSFSQSSNKVASFHHRVSSTTGSRGFWFSSSASPEPSDKDSNPPAEGQETVVDGKDTSTDVDTSASADGQATEKIENADTEDDLSRDDLVKLVTEKEELVNLKEKEIEELQDKNLRYRAEMENIMSRTRREAENSKKFAIQSFAKSLLDVADNLGRASAVVKDSFSKIDQAKDTTEALPLLKTLLEGVEMTEKQLAEVFKKYGVEKFDPMSEQFDPNRHYALFQIADSSKPPGTVASVLKSGYMFHDRVLRAAEVGVTEEASNSEDGEKTSESVKE